MGLCSKLPVGFDQVYEYRGTIGSFMGRVIAPNPINATDLSPAYIEHDTALGRAAIEFF